MKKFFALFMAFVFVGMVKGYALADYAYYIPYFTSKTGEGTGLGLRNGSASENAQVSIIIYDHNGTQRMVDRKTIAARGQTAFMVGQGLDTEGSIQLTSDQPLVAMCSVFFASGVGYEVPVTQTLSPLLYIPQAAQDSQWNTSIIINNPHNSSTTITLAYISPGGQPGSTQTDSIPANGSEKYELSTLLPGNLVSGGSVEIVATPQGVSALVVYSTAPAGGLYVVGFGAVDTTSQIENYTPEQYAVVATVAPDYSSGAHSVIPVDEPRIAQNNLLPTISDITVAASGRFFYRIEKFMGDNVTKFDIHAPDTVIWQYSTLDVAESSSNPYGLIFVSDTKAYLLRYDTTRVWIVNPSAASANEFKVGELDLSPYADSDGIPEMANGVMVGNKLFITMQRLDRNNNYARTNTAYLAVFDALTDTEINTGVPNPDSVKGIPLPIDDPMAMQYFSANDTIYIQGAGTFESSWSGTPAEYTGGIISVDPETYTTAMIVDDGDDTNHPYGNISGMAIVSPTKGYFIGYAGWGDNTLYSFNPSTGVVMGEASNYLKNKNIAGLESGVYLDKNGRLWVCNATDAEVVILNPTDDTIEATISTNLNPQKVVFCEP